MSADVTSRSYRAGRGKAPGAPQAQRGSRKPRADAQRKAGRDATRASIILKLFSTETTQALQTLSLDMEGVNGVAADPDDRWAATSAYGFLRTRSATISGGSSEIQRNIIGEKVLGLPREPAVDVGVPWRDGIDTLIDGK